MASTFTTSNRINKQGTGDNSGAWGAVLNEQALDTIDEALDGVETVTVNGIVTLTSVDGTTDQARNRVLKFTGLGGTVIVPGVTKVYVIHNICSGDVTIKTATAVGTVISRNAVTFVYCDGISFASATNMWPLASGTVTTPSLYFVNDTNTGFYRIASDRFAITCGGVKQADITMADFTFTNEVVGPKAKLGAPAWSHSSLTSRLSIAYAGGSLEFGIVLRPQGNNTDPLVFENAAGIVVGSIVQSAVGTTYNTTSDYRLKGNVVDLAGSGAFIDALRPRQWTWTTNGDAGAGFIAHEAQEVSPTSVSGEKDAVDDQGNPRYQSMQPGSDEIVANIVAELQALRARVAALESA